MSNYSNTLNQIHYTLSTANKIAIREGLLYMFDADLDFTENEEYFRKNTIKKGYLNEAHRIVDEYIKKREIDTLPKVTKAVNHMADKLFGNVNYYMDYAVSIEQVGTKTYSIAISYIN